MGWRLYEYEYKPLRQKTTAWVEAEHIDFCKKFKDTEQDQNPATRKCVHFSIGNQNFAWNPETKIWTREVKKKEVPPDYKHFYVYGEFTIDGAKKQPLNVFACRIPGSGVNWHKQILPAIAKLIKTKAKADNPKKKPYFNIDCSSDEKANKKSWDKKKGRITKKFDFVKNKFVEV